VRSKSDTVSQRPTLSSLSDGHDVVSPRASRAVESNSPDSVKATIAKSPQASKLWDAKDASPRIHRETERSLEEESPASSKLGKCNRFLIVSVFAILCLLRTVKQVALH
jgi:hypothetical protein